MMGNRDLERGGGTKPRNGSYQPPPTTAAPYYMETSESQWTSWLVPMIVVANVAMFIVIMFVNNCPSNINNFGRGGGRRQCVARFLGRLSFQPLQDNPLFGPSSSTLQNLGALEWDKVVHGHQGWRLFTCIWLHAGVVHLLANMLSLVFIGIRLEQQFGFVRVGIIYVLSGIGGSVLSCLFIQGSISVGASGALFGLLGAMLSELLTNWSIYTNKAAALITLIIIIAINLAVGLLPHVDNYAHIGGFMGGFLLGFVLLLRPQFGWLERQHLPAEGRLKSKFKAYQYVLLLIASILLIVGKIPFSSFGKPSAVRGLKRKLERSERVDVIQLERIVITNFLVKSNFTNFLVKSNFKTDNITVIDSLVKLNTRNNGRALPFISFHSFV